MMPGDLIRLAERLLGKPRVIFDRGGRSPYLSRYYLVGAPTMPDGSWPFDALGAPREGAVWPNKALGVYLHHFHKGDDEPELHNHPWRLAVSLVLAGGYVEERREADDTVTTRVVRPGAVNVIRSTTFHRVELLDGREAWTLFVVGPKFTGWGFWSRTSKEFTPWREFINARRTEAAHAT